MERGLGRRLDARLVDAVRAAEQYGHLDGCAEDVLRRLERIGAEAGDDPRETLYELGLLR